MLDLLLAQHREILEAANALLVAARHSPRIGMDELSRRRRHLSSLIRQHHRSEEELVFAPLLRNGTLETSPQLKAALRRIQDEKSHYSANIGQWTPERIAADWDGYAESVAVRVRGLAAFIEDEEEHLYRPAIALMTAPVPGRSDQA